jgi:hypothetical protein
MYVAAPDSWQHKYKTHGLFSTQTSMLEPYIITKPQQQNPQRSKPAIADSSTHTPAYLASAAVHTAAQ